MKTLALAFSTLALSTPSFAQDWTPVDYMSPAVYGLMNQNALTEGILEEEFANQRNSKAIAEASKRSKVAGSAVPPTLTFPLSSALRTQAYKNVVSEMRRADPGSADRFSAMIDAGLIGQVEQGVEQLGLQNNDVADGLTCYWLAAWQAVYADGATPDAATIQAVRRQSRAMLSRSANVINASAAEKQRQTDSFFILALFIDVGLQQSKGDAKTLAAFQSDTQENAKKMGIDLASMTLTNEGFREKKSE